MLPNGISGLPRVWQTIPASLKRLKRLSTISSARNESERFFKGESPKMIGRTKLRSAIDSLPIPVLWERLGLPGRVSGNCVIRSPLRDDDRRPSFSIFADGRRFKDHATGETGDSFDLYQ